MSSFSFSALHHQLNDCSSYLDPGGSCSCSYIFSFSVFGCVCVSGSAWLCVSGVMLGVSGVMLGVSGSCGIGVSSVMFLSVMWGVSGGLSGSNKVTLGMFGLVVLVRVVHVVDSLVEMMRSAFLVGYMSCFVVVLVALGCHLV